MTDSSSIHPAAQPDGIIRDLWLRMTEVWGHRWTSAYGIDAFKGAGGTWAIGLAGLSREQINRGLVDAIAWGEEWPPSLPRFRALCLGIPSLMQVRLDLTTGQTERMPFTRQVWLYIDSYAFGRADSDRADRMLREAYELACLYVGKGGQLPVIAAGLIEHEKTTFCPASPQHVQSIFQELGRHFGEPTNGSSGVASDETTVAPNLNPT